MAPWVKNPTSMRMRVQSLALLRGLRIWHCRKLQCRLWMLWLWHRPAAAALIQLLAWELPYVSDAAIKRKKKRKKTQLIKKLKIGHCPKCKT